MQSLFLIFFMIIFSCCNINLDKKNSPNKNTKKNTFFKTHDFNIGNLLDTSNYIKDSIYFFDDELNQYNFTYYYLDGKLKVIKTKNNTYLLSYTFVNDNNLKIEYIRNDGLIEVIEEFKLTYDTIFYFKLKKLEKDTMLNIRTKYVLHDKIQSLREVIKNYSPTNNLFYFQPIHLPKTASDEIKSPITYNKNNNFSLIGIDNLNIFKLSISKIIDTSIFYDSHVDEDNVRRNHKEFYITICEFKYSDLKLKKIMIKDNSGRYLYIFNNNDNKITLKNYIKFDSTLTTYSMKNNVVFEEFIDENSIKERTKYIIKNSSNNSIIYRINEKTKDLYYYKQRSYIKNNKYYDCY